MKLKKITIISVIAIIVFSLILGIIYFDTHYAIIDKKIYKNDVKYLRIFSLDNSRIREINKCAEVEIMYLSGANKNAISKFMDFHNIKFLLLMQSEISSLDCEKLNKFTSLDNLEITSYSVIDFKKFTNPSVTVIDIFNSDLENIESLSKCKSLKSLTLSNTTYNNYIIMEDDKYVLSDSDSFASLDNIISLSVYVDEIQDISRILEMDSLETFCVNRDSISEEDVKLLEDKGIAVTYCDKNE